MSGNSTELIIELIDIFNDQVIEFSSNLQTYLDNKDYDALGKLAHKAKSSVSIMGMNELSEKLRDLEMHTKEAVNIEDYQEYVNFFKTESLEAVKELKDYRNEINKL